MLFGLIPFDIDSILAGMEAKDHPAKSSQPNC
jgi:hypothetical protein